MCSVLLFPFYRQVTEAQKANGLSKVTQLVNCKGGSEIISFKSKIYSLLSKCKSICYLTIQTNYFLGFSYFLIFKLQDFCKIGGGSKFS